MTFCCHTLLGFDGDLLEYKMYNFSSEPTGVKGCIVKCEGGVALIFYI